MEAATWPGMEPLRTRAEDELRVLSADEAVEHVRNGEALAEYAHDPEFCAVILTLVEAGKLRVGVDSDGATYMRFAE